MARLVCEPAWSPKAHAGRGDRRTPGRLAGVALGGGGFAGEPGEGVAGVVEGAGWLKVQMPPISSISSGRTRDQASSASWMAASACSALPRAA